MEKYVGLNPGSQANRSSILSQRREFEKQNLVYSVQMEQGSAYVYIDLADMENCMIVSW